MRLSAEEEHHLLHVLRAHAGEEVTVFDGQGREAAARLESEHPVVLKVINVAVPARQRTISLTLIQAIPKGNRMDWIIEKATELGVVSIWPVKTARVVPCPDERRSEKRVERWRKIALNAAKQCGTNWLPEIRSIEDYGKTLNNAAGFDLFVVGSLAKDARLFRLVLDDARGRKPQPRKIALLVGPEGDLTAEELKLAGDAGAVPVTFGPLVLRVDTAALYGISILMNEFATCLTGS